MPGSRLGAGQHTWLQASSARVCSASHDSAMAEMASRESFAQWPVVRG